MPENKKNDYFSKMEENNAKALEEQKELNEQLKQQMQAQQRAMEEQNRTTEADLAKQNEEQEKGFREFILQQRVDYENSLVEDAKQVKADQQKSRWGAITEALVGLANLVGVGAGANNQQIQSYSKDWMQKADENLRANQKRRDALHQQGRALEQQLLALRTNNGKALASLKASNAVKEIAGQSNIDKAIYGLNSGLVKERAAGANDILTKELNQSNADRNFARVSKNERYRDPNENIYSIILNAKDGASTSTAYTLSKENLLALAKRYRPNEYDTFRKMSKADQINKIRDWASNSPVNASSREERLAFVKRYHPYEYNAFSRMSEEDQINKMRDWDSQSAELDKDIRAYGRAGKANQEDPIEDLINGGKQAQDKYWWNSLAQN